MLARSRSRSCACSSRSVHLTAVLPARRRRRAPARVAQHVRRHIQIDPALIAAVHGVQGKEQWPTVIIGMDDEIVGRLGHVERANALATLVVDRRVARILVSHARLHSMLPASPSTASILPYPSMASAMVKWSTLLPSVRV